MVNERRVGESETLEKVGLSQMKKKFAKDLK
jgi:hypothetical protein